MASQHIPGISPDAPHRRRNPLTGDWLLVSPHRVERPWQGRLEPHASFRLPPYDPGCYLCPGNLRANGERNPMFTSVHVFDNDFSALLPSADFAVANPNVLLQHESIRGICRVLCFSPRHDLTLAQMSIAEICGVVDLWAEQVRELQGRYRWVQVFENRGEIMGCSNPHPHGQLWAGSELPNEPSKEEIQQRLYREQNHSVLLLDYLELECKQPLRVVAENSDWVIVVPYWAVWPFETLVIPRRHIQRLPDLEAAERRSLAEIMKRLLIRYDNLFQAPFPYTMGWHGAPGTGPAPHWQLHAHFYPPLLRSATVKKFMVGYEMLAEPQRDFTPEEAARRLQTLSHVHYTEIAGETAT
jgi:UDPglucose--hexose-1-phosphate uridylyltransferase